MLSVVQAESRILIVMVSVIMLNAVMPSVVMQGSRVLTTIGLNVTQDKQHLA